MIDDKWQLLDLGLPSVERIQQMPAGVEMDALIAHHVFRREGIGLFNKAWLRDATGRSVPPYSLDRAASAEVRYAPCPTPLAGYFLEDRGTDGPQRFTVSFGWLSRGAPGSWFAVATGPTEPLTVCRARLVAARMAQDSEADEEVQRWLDLNGLTHDLGGEGG